MVKVAGEIKGSKHMAIQKVKLLEHLKDFKL